MCRRHMPTATMRFGAGRFRGVSREVAAEGDAAVRNEAEVEPHGPQLGLGRSVDRPGRLADEREIPARRATSPTIPARSSMLAATEKHLLGFRV